MGPKSDVEARELAYHEKLYSGFAQQHFAKAAVRALRRHMVERICRVTGANAGSRVLSLGCGIGDTELLLARRVKSLVGVDLSPAAIRQARADASAQGVSNIEFVEGSIGSVEGEFDVIIAIFFLHHLPDSDLESLPIAIRSLLKPGGSFYSLDPSRYRLSGAVGSLLLPGLMKKYQTEDERELDPEWTKSVFGAKGFRAGLDYYDFASSPLAGLFPSWEWGYRFARSADEVIRRIPLVRKLGSNFEVIAQRPAG
jgi:2-polyprenyl-3-methyl-5-hydroxy-6-metoxy-1,4-benzoquinol methylase